MTPSPAERDRPTEILDAAFERFRQYGFRNTSMDDIARAAGISRPLVYQHFANKEAVLRELALRLHAEVLAEVAVVLADADLPVADQVAAAFIAKLRIPVEVIGPSEHHDEIMDTSSRLAGDIAEAEMGRFDALLHKRLTAARRAGQLPARTDGVPVTHLVRLLRDATGGIAKASLTDPDGWRGRVTALVRLTLT